MRDSSPYFPRSDFAKLPTLELIGKEVGGIK
jgi:hypothetical protein